MKLSDYVIQFLVERGVTHLFGMSGGAAVHLFDSAARHRNMAYVCSQHEQSAAMAADGYARTTGKMGVAVTTSGPGATNLLTGTCCSYFDSVPTLMITGQVATHRLKGDRQIRQLGFQETDVLSIFGSVTKYAAQVKRPEDIRKHLEAAWFWAFEGRPGSVLIDLPDDLQRAEIDPDKLEGFIKPERQPSQSLDQQFKDLAHTLSQSQRPVLVLGGGLSTPRLGNELQALIDTLSFPVLQTWAGLDLLVHDHPLRVGSFGVYAPRVGNFAIQNADLILCLGTRLSQNVTGGLLDTFAREAQIAMIDAERGELDKFDGRGITIHHRLCCRLDHAIPALLQAISDHTRPDLGPWRNQIDHWKTILPDDRPKPPLSEEDPVEAYGFIAELSQQLPLDELIFVDTGGNLTWTCNGIALQANQRLISAWNNTPMGYALPAAIGAAVANPDRGVTCIIGDGGLMICLAELATLVRHQLKVRVLVFDNRGHGIQKQTLETWLSGRYVAVDSASGLALPPIPAIASAMGLAVIEVHNNARAAEALSRAYQMNGPVLCNILINPDQKLYPVVKFGAPLEDQLPALNPDLIRKEMLVAPPSKHTDLRSGTPGI
jgi:acetolactate synthase-1/2/3 large subunit